MDMENSKALIQFLLFLRQSRDVLFFLYARRLRGYTATAASMNREIKRNWKRHNQNLNFCESFIQKCFDEKLAMKSRNCHHKLVRKNLLSGGIKFFEVAGFPFGTKLSFFLKFVLYLI